MGLKADLLDAITSAYVDTNSQADSLDLPDISDGSYNERLMHYQTEAIAKFLTNVEFRITKLNAPITVEELKSPPLLGNLEIETLLGEYQPVLKTLRQLGDPLGLGSTIDKLEDEIRKAVAPLVEGAAKTAFNLGKSDGGLESKGYVHIGEDPDSQDAFDVEDEDGQKEFTTVKLLRDDIEEFL